jgi:SAM-dependent methyltransferase
VAARYEAAHGEIYNPVEQARLRAALEWAVGAISSGGGVKKALDYGCGAGNLTGHLIGLGLSTTAADVSSKFLELVRGKYLQSGLLGTLRISGRGLPEIAGPEFDFAGAYSVLHHIPDYLAAVRELARVLRPGGVMYLDHEGSESSWRGDEVYSRFRAELARVLPPVKPDWKRFLRPFYYRARWRLLLDPRYIEEGDLHVWPDDHVETDKLVSLLENEGFAIVRRQDYLLYRRGCPQALYDGYKDRCSDTCLLVAKKIS